ncbi:GNAT family N-acetyltransferase [Alphaproteobacteria bacterium AO1-B]|nr:GNAT family N-acetyltransferase [Alphaproteobacteria bacterium AO1-B]
MTTTSNPTTTVRPFRPGDLSHLLPLNNAAVPAVNELSAEELLDLIGQSLVCLVAEVDEEPVGFLLSISDGADYGSANYRWLSENVSNFSYTDRICVDETRRGLKIGEKLYNALFDQLKDTGRSFVCEVNSRPPNPGSLRFHQRLGFQEIGTADHGEKAVVFLRKDPLGAAE